MNMQGNKSWQVIILGLDLTPQWLPFALVQHAGVSMCFFLFLASSIFFGGASGTFAEAWPPILRGLLPLYNNHRLTVCIPSCCCHDTLCPRGSHVESPASWGATSRSLRVIWAPCQVAVQHPRACTGLGMILRSWRLLVSVGLLLLSTVILSFFPSRPGYMDLGDNLRGLQGAPARASHSKKTRALTIVKARICCKSRGVGLVSQYEIWYAAWSAHPDSIIESYHIIELYVYTWCCRSCFMFIQILYLYWIISN